MLTLDEYFTIKFDPMFQVQVHDQQTVSQTQDIIIDMVEEPVYSSSLPITIAARMHKLWK